MQMIIHILVTTALIFVVGRLIDGIEVHDGKAAFFAAVGLGLANAFLAPILIVLTFPINLMTLGLFTFVINALMLMLVGAIVEGFEVDDFMSALKGALLLAVMNFGIGIFLG